MELVPSPPTPTPVPTATPTESPTPTEIPLPTDTPAPTDTPLPTATPTPPGPVRTPVSGDASADFNAMLDAMSAVTSYRFHSEIAIGPDGQRVSLTGDGEYQAPDRLHYTYPGLGLALEAVIIGPDSYIRLPDGSWQKGGLDPASKPLRAPLNSRDLLGLLTYAAEARLLGDEPLPGGDTPARHLAITLAPAALNPATQLGWTQASGDLWLAPDSRRLVRLRLVFSGARAGGTDDGVVTVDFRDYDAPIVIRAPGP